MVWRTASRLEPTNHYSTDTVNYFVVKEFTCLWEVRRVYICVCVCYLLTYQLHVYTYSSRYVHSSHQVYPALRWHPAPFQILTGVLDYIYIYTKTNYLIKKYTISAMTFLHILLPLFCKFSQSIIFVSNPQT